jgi:pyridoxamine 5'-phosphate oxidase
LLEELGPDPFEVFEEWFAHAYDRAQPEPDAMAVATSRPDGQVSVRFVLLRGYDRRGFAFYTNRQSRKGEDLALNPRAALAFRWEAVNRQVRITGPVERISDAESDGYFSGRPRGSQLSAWASDQSRPLKAKAELDQRLAEVDARFAGATVPRPPWWGGYRVVPEQFEFWQQGEYRLHDRFEYRRGPDGGWSCVRLNP